MNQSPIDEVLIRARDTLFTRKNAPVNGWESIHTPTLKQALYQLLLDEVIGSDETTDYPAPASWVGEEAAVRNKLRADQRSKLKGLFDE